MTKRRRYIINQALESVATSDVSYRKIHSDIYESYTDDIDEGDEANTIDQHEDSLVKITSLIERLIAIHDIHASLLDLQYRIEVLGRAISESPEKVFDGDIQTLKEEEAQIRSELRKSTIPCNHYVRNLCMELTPKLVNLTSPKPAEQIDASIFGSKNPSSTQIRLPKLALPIFKGDPMDWAGFWA